MTARKRQLLRGALALYQHLLRVDVGKLPDAWEKLCELASPDPLLGEQWLVRQRGAVQDVRDWLTRLQEGDDS